MGLELLAVQPWSIQIWVQSPPPSVAGTVNLLSSSCNNNYADTAPAGEARVNTPLVAPDEGLWVRDSSLHWVMHNCRFSKYAWGGGSPILRGKTPVTLFNRKKQNKRKKQTNKNIKTPHSPFTGQIMGLSNRVDWLGILFVPGCENGPLGHEKRKPVLRADGLAK